MMLIRLLITQLVTKIEDFIYSQNFILVFTIGTEEQLHSKNTISLLSGPSIKDWHLTELAS
ncbi:Uncharacterised protein [Sphingobacterium multivorum]|uniref:Uncharacterized protein n=1 Tax=Sphingobacterium multivorum TaxID=28454 RepID=A0A2X2IY23_SPHMU|nr:Uncharacterised protein [Sphingobacterium multivorum]